MKLSTQFRKSLGRVWKTMREQAGLTQIEVADSLGYSTGQFISNVEAGRCRFPVHQLPKIQRLYKLKTNELMDLVLQEEENAMRDAFSEVFKS